MISRQERLADIAAEIDEIISEVPEEFNDSMRKNLKTELLSYATRVLDALTVAELQHEGAFKRLVLTLRQDARMSVRRVKP
jgi:hypothetical protein